MHFIMYIWFYMEVSWHGGTPKSSIFRNIVPIPFLYPRYPRYQALEELALNWPRARCRWEQRRTRFRSPRTWDEKNGAPRLRQVRRWQVASRWDGKVYGVYIEYYIYNIIIYIYNIYIYNIYIYITYIYITYIYIYNIYIYNIYIYRTSECGYMEPMVNNDLCLRMVNHG